MSESERPQRLVEMRLAVSAFYAGPTDDTHKAAHDAMLNYRRTFRGIDTKSLQALSEKIECVDGGIDGGECLLLRKRKNAEHEMLVGVIINKYHSLSIASLEYHANVALDLAMELKLHGDIPLAWINEDRRLMKGEKELAELRGRLSRDIDRAGRNEGIGEGELLEYLRVYAAKARDTLKPVKPGASCDAKLMVTADGRQCARAVSDVNAARTGDPSKGPRPREPSRAGGRMRLLRFSMMCLRLTTEFQ